ncbi:MAG: hypothetical protein K0U12_06685, partial [Gammaproteobacteria bacterium]|nr:hypothetical protein [Gammaproteobacteria bacterium]
LQKQHLSELVQKSISSGLDVTGNIRCVKSIETEKTARFRESANTAIIYMDGDYAAKAEAEKIFGEDSTYSISEIKGLEFKRVILWNVISNATAVGIEKQLKLSKKNPKSELSIDTLTKRLKYLFIAITRAEVELIIRQSSLSHPSVSAVYANITSGVTTSEHYLDLEDPDLSNEEQWLNLADKHYKTDDHINRANRIYAGQIQKLIDEGAINEAFNIMLRQAAQADKLYKTKKIKAAENIYRSFASYLAEDSEELKTIKLQQIEALYFIEEQKKAEAIRATLPSTTEDARDDAEEKITTPSSPKTSRGDAEEKSFTPPIEPLCIKAGAIEEAEDTDSKARATAIEARIENYQLKFTTDTESSRSKRKGKKRGTKKKHSKTNVTFNRQLGLTQINAIISCKNDEEIRNITAQHLAALLCTTQDPTIPNEKYDAFILKVLTINPSISDSLAREIQSLLDEVDINGTVLLNMLKTKQPHFYIHGIRVIAELAKTNDIVRLWLVVTLKTKDAGPIARLPETLLDNDTFTRWIAQAETNPDILNAIFQRLDQIICINIINTEPNNFVKLIEIAEHHDGCTRMLLNALNQTSKLNSALLHALTDTTCALPTIQLLQQNKDDIPDDILVLLFTSGPERILRIDQCCPAALEGLNDLAKIKPSICTRLINYPREKGATFGRLLLAVTTHSKQGSPLLIAMAKHNNDVLEALIPALSFKDTIGLTPLHNLAMFYPELFMTAVRLAETGTNDTGLSPMLTTYTTNEELFITPLVSLLHASKPTMREFIVLAEEKPALREALIHTFKLNSANDLLYASILDIRNNDFSCLIALFNLAKNHGDFCSHLTNLFINKFAVEDRRSDR